ncbi:hypothetical protein H5410_004058, partial [Solanum commersonii]
GDRCLASGDAPKFFAMSSLPQLELKQFVASFEFILLVYEPGRRYIVSLERDICNCGRFQLNEIPCAHAVAILKNTNIIYMLPHCFDYYIAVNMYQIH